jgi:glycosyltransferase involved in cell wall biosynthesis
MARRPLRIGLNLLYLVSGAGGLGRYARELMRALRVVEPDIELTGFVSAELPPDVLAAPWAEGIEWVELPVTVTHGPPWNFVNTLRSQWATMPWLAARRRLDVVHGLANTAPLVSPRVATVVTVLDLIWMRHPQTMGRRARIGMKVVTPLSARRADRVIAISDTVKQDLVNTLALPARKIDAIPLGIRLDELVAPTPVPDLRATLGIPEDREVVLCVAQKRPHKNLTGLIRALAQLPEPRPVLVLPGAPTHYEEQIRALAAHEGVVDDLRLPEWLSDADLEAAYGLAAAFVLPSFEEGFGLPILEAMRRDVPVACSRASSLGEVAGDAAELFDPHDPTDIARALRRLLADPARRQELVMKGQVRCANFTWERTATATVDVYRRAIAQRMGPG